LNGNTALIGSAYQDLNTSGPGAVFLFDATTGQQGLKLFPSDGGSTDGFGEAIASSGNTALIGSPFSSPLGLYTAGSAYLFDITSGQQLFKLTAADEAANDWFGWSVAMRGKLALIGAPQSRSSLIGNAYLFDTTTGQQLRKFIPTDTSKFRQFGQSVALDGNKAVVGATNALGSHGRTGAAYVFDVNTGQQLLKLEPTGGLSGGQDSFGESVAIGNNRILVGATADLASGPGGGDAAYLFDATTGQQLFKFVVPNTSPPLGTGLGYSVAINDNIALIGAPWVEAAYAFNVTTGQLLAKLIPGDSSSDFHNFGRSVAMSNHRMLVGAPWENDNSGAAYLFNMVPEPTGCCLSLCGAAGFLITLRGTRRGQRSALF